MSCPFTVSIDYPEKRLQGNTTYELEGIIFSWDKNYFINLQGK